MLHQQEKSLVGIELKHIILDYAMLIMQVLINFNFKELIRNFVYVENQVL